MSYTSAPHVLILDSTGLGDRSYIAHDGVHALVVDPQRDIDRVEELLAEHGLTLTHVAETHIHNDYVTGGLELARRHGATYVVPGDVDLSYEGLAVRDGDSFTVGDLTVDVLHTPGHTPACLTYVVGDAAFVGDTLFMPDFGTARCDFPGGSSETLYESVQKILALPDDTRIFVGHDYKAPGRDEYAWETTVGEQKTKNIHVGEGKSKEDFIEMRDTRDATLAMPKLIIPSLQVNMRAGQMPEPDEKGDVFLKVPVNKL